MENNKKMILLGCISLIVGICSTNNIWAMEKLSDSTKKEISDVQRSIFQDYRNLGRTNVSILAFVPNISKNNFFEGSIRDHAYMLGLIKKVIKDGDNYLANLRNESGEPGEPVASHLEKQYFAVSNLLTKLQKLFNLVKNAYKITDKNIETYERYL